ncbi:MAG TPA: metalloregulator ArsR/SmtB family transcription factor [Acidimicrobiales bacterium]|jgi:DNA-binding transcriptional ArsR family regulator|nr:metalloregulator ArsR/SmtB family transcription factor [Acidimicrobiales bacterium]
MAYTCGVDALLNAIAAPRRREILRLVRDEELSAGAIAAHFSISRPGVSQHVRVLVEAGLLAERRQGTHRLYRTRREAFDELLRFLDDFWGVSLERLRIAVESDLEREQYDVG